MIPPTINDYGGAPVATHDHACAVCLKRPSVLNISTGRMDPCWGCQSEGWQVVRLSRFWRWVLTGGAA
jgi:hypothetical protein